MSPLTQEWVDKAEADWLATGQLIRLVPNRSGRCSRLHRSADLRTSLPASLGASLKGGFGMKHGCIGVK
jgi:hypothetical protein